MKTHVALVLDSSGSMAKHSVETIGGFNEQLTTLREMATEDHEVGVTLTVFGTTATVKYVDRPVNEVQDLTTETYKPSGWTALYDAVGMTIVNLEDNTGASEDDAFLVNVFSDGEENQSKEYTSDTLAAVISRLKETGKWTFSYLGSNQDLAQVQAILGVGVGNVCSYADTGVGTVQAFAANAKATKKYFAARSRGESQCDSLYSDDGEIADAETVVAKD